MDGGDGGTAWAMAEWARKRESDWLEAEPDFFSDALGLAFQLVCLLLLVASCITLFCKLAAPIFASLLRRRLLRIGHLRTINGLHLRLHVLPTSSLTIYATELESSALLAKFLNEYMLGLFLPSQLTAMHLIDVEVQIWLWPLARCLVMPSRGTERTVFDVSIRSMYPSYRVLDHSVWASAGARDKAMATLFNAKELSLEAHAFADSGAPSSAAATPMRGAASPAMPTASPRTPPPPPSTRASAAAASSQKSPGRLHRWVRRLWGTAAVQGRLVRSLAVRVEALHAAIIVGPYALRVAARALRVAPHYDGRSIDLAFTVADASSVDVQRTT